MDRLEAGEFREIFSMCFQGLPKAQASTFLLKEVQQETTEEVCKQLEISDQCDKHVCARSNRGILLPVPRLRFGL